MSKSYIEVLPKNYFDNLYARVVKPLVRGENVLVSALWGCGGNTFPNLFLRLAKQDTSFGGVYYFDPEVAGVRVEEWQSRIDFISKSKTVVIVPLKAGGKTEILEQLHRWKASRPEEVVFLVTTDHEGIIKPHEYTARSTVFFSERFNLLPFDRKQTEMMMRLTCKFYGWKVEPGSEDKIFRLSGGVPRLIKHICKNISERGADINNLKLFLSDPGVIFEMDYLVKLLVGGGGERGQILGLVDEKGKIKSELLLEYYKKYQVQLITQLYPGLSRLEEKVLTFLYLNQGLIVGPEKIGDLMLMGENNYSLWAIYKLISRLKPKIRKNFQLKAFKGRGYMLIPTVVG